MEFSLSRNTEHENGATELSTRDEKQSKEDNGAVYEVVENHQKPILPKRPKPDSLRGRDIRSMYPHQYAELQLPEELYYNTQAELSQEYASLADNTKNTALSTYATLH